MKFIPFSFLIAAIISIFWIPAFAQDATGEQPYGEEEEYLFEYEAPEDGEIQEPFFVERLSDARYYIGEYVEIYGISGERRDGMTVNTWLFKLVDDWNNTVWVRSNNIDEWERGLHYRVWGTVVEEGDEIVIIEDKREYDPPIVRDEDDEEKDEDTEEKGMALWQVVVLILAGLALVIGLFQLIVPGKKKKRKSDLMPGPTIAAGPSVSRPPIAASPPKAPPGTTVMWGMLNVVSGTLKGKMFPMTSHKIYIGRDRGMDIQLPDEANVVSGSHAFIEVRDKGRLVFTDKSTNGSKVNDVAVKNKEIELPLDATITIGPHTLKLSDVTVPTPELKSPGGTVMLGDNDKIPAKTKQYMGVDLVIVGGESDRGKRHSVSGYDTTVGRDPENDFVLEDEFVSRKHAVINYDDGEWIIVNVSDSEQGTMVNGVKVEESAPLKPGDRISLGSTVIEFKSTRES